MVPAGLFQLRIFFDFNYVANNYYIPTLKEGYFLLAHETATFLLLLDICRSELLSDMFEQG